MPSAKTLAAQAIRFWKHGRIAILLTLTWIFGVGLAQFAFSDRWSPGACVPLCPPWNAFIYWLGTGMEKPISEYFNRREIIRFSVTTSVLISLLGLLGWWAYSRRPIRLRVRSTMLAIAIFAIEWTGSGKVGSIWEHWDSYAKLADHYRVLEEFTVPTLNSDPVTPEEAELERVSLARYRGLRLRYEHLMWRPWLADELDTQ